jgi:hypothetical protein
MTYKFFIAFASARTSRTAFGFIGAIAHFMVGVFLSLDFGQIWCATPREQAAHEGLTKLILSLVPHTIFSLHSSQTHNVPTEQFLAQFSDR